MAKKSESKINAGDQVEWKSSGGASVGKVIKKITSPTNIKSHKVAASAEHPQFLVKSDKSGKKAAHKPEAFKKSK